MGNEPDADVDNESIVSTDVLINFSCVGFQVAMQEKEINKIKEEHYLHCFSIWVSEAKNPFIIIKH